MSESLSDLADEYEEYLSRFDAELGASDVGAFSKYKGRLIKRHSYEDFAKVHAEYLEIAKTYFDSIDRGDTINDIVVKLLRDRAIELILPSPV